MLHGLAEITAGAFDIPPVGEHNSGMSRQPSSEPNMAPAKMVGGSRKLANIQALRGIAAVLIVVFHAAIYFYASVPNGTMPRWLHIGEARVDVFFIISGFVMVYVTRNRSGSLASQRDFLVDRITRIYPLYWIATLPVLFVCVFMPRSTVIALNAGTLWHSLSLFPGPDQFPLLRVGWTLSHEMYFYLVFSFFLLGKRETLPLKLWSWAACIVAAPFVLPANWLSLPWVALVTNALTLEFIAGCFLALMVWPKTVTNGSWLLAGSALLVLLGTFVMPNPDAIAGFTRLLFFGAPGVCIVFGALAMEQHGRAFDWGWLQRLGDASFQIYLWHLTVISAVSRYALKAGMPPLPCFVLTVVSAFVASFCVHLWVEKPLLKWRSALHSKLGKQKATILQ